MYRVLLERGAEKDLSRLSSEIHERVIFAIRALATTPRPAGCRKLARSRNDWRIRVGDYRVVYERRLRDRRRDPHRAGQPRTPPPRGVSLKPAGVL